MEYTIDEKTEREFLHCIYIGSYIMRYALLEDGEKYEEVEEKIYEQALAARGMSGTDGEISDLRDRIIDGVLRTVESHRARIFFDKLIKRDKQEE